MEEFPAWIYRMVFACKWCLTCKIEDQYTERGPVVLVVQKEVLGQYLALKMAERKGFILVTKFQEN